MTKYNEQKILEELSVSNFQGLEESEITKSKLKVLEKINEQKNSILVKSNFMSYTKQSKPGLEVFSKIFNLKFYFISGLAFALLVATIGYQYLSNPSSDSDTGNTIDKTSLLSKIDKKYQDSLGFGVDDFEKIISPKASALENQATKNKNLYIYTVKNAEELDQASQKLLDKLVSEQKEVAYKINYTYKSENDNRSEVLYIYQDQLLDPQGYFDSPEYELWFDVMDNNPKSYLKLIHSQDLDDQASVNNISLNPKIYYLDILNKALKGENEDIAEMIFQTKSSLVAKNTSSKISYDSANENFILELKNTDYQFQEKVFFDQDLNPIGIDNGIYGFYQEMEVQELSLQEFKSLVSEFESQHQYQTYDISQAYMVKDEKLPYLVEKGESNFDYSALSFINLQNSDYREYRKYLQNLEKPYQQTEIDESFESDCFNTDECQINGEKGFADSDYYIQNNLIKFQISQNNLSDYIYDSIITSTFNQNFDYNDLIGDLIYSDNFCTFETTLNVAEEDILAKVFGDCERDKNKKLDDGGIPDMVYFEYQELKYIIRFSTDFSLQYEDLKNYKINFVSNQTNPSAVTQIGQKSLY